MRDSYNPKDYSIGVIPFCQTQLDIHYLLIHHTKGHRGFPKGHTEKLPLLMTTQEEGLGEGWGEGESMQQTALRELREETGVTQVTLGDMIYTEHYEFNHKGVHVTKQVDYFLGKCDECRPTTIQPEETVEASWKTYDEAVKLLPQGSIEALLDPVHNILKLA